MINPKGFVQRETVHRSIRSHMNSSRSHLEQSNDLFYSFIDSNSQGRGGDTASFGEDDVVKQVPLVRNVASESDLVSVNNGQSKLLHFDAHSEKH